MKTYSISELADFFHLSRSTLLYYDRIGVLKAPKRSAAGYRMYTENERTKLERICFYRDAGLALSEIRRLLEHETGSESKVLEKRLREISEQIVQLRSQQHLIAAMLKVNSDAGKPVVDKDMWVSMLKAAGMDDAAMKQWHTEFERQAPDAHHELLRSLGIEEDEAQQIREWSSES